MRPGDYAWCAIGGYELVAILKRWPLLSEAFDTYRERFPKTVHVAAIYVLLHLLRRWPQRFDPLYQIATRVKR